jgi:hypothetical protein
VADINDTSSVLPDAGTQERVWAALRKDLADLGQVHGLDFG